METRIHRVDREVVMSPERPTAIIGERINPSGKKALAESLRAGDLSVVRREAVAQQEAGADVIDVNVAAFGVNEVALLPGAVRVVQEAVGVPLCIDTPNPDALAAALDAVDGKPLINSVSGEERSLARVLPLVRAHKAAVIGLLQDDDGIPQEVDARIRIAKKILERTGALGIPQEDVVFDCLALAVGANEKSGVAALETMRRIREELGHNLTLGASNISFGLPDRGLLNRAFVSMAVAAGATALIVNAARIRPTILAADLLAGRDRRARRYVGAFRERRAQVA